MVECYLAKYGFTETLSVFHSYILKFKLETYEALIAIRQALVSANAPIELVKNVDLTMLQRQYSDNPEYVDKFAMWEKYRPFSDKSEQAINVIISCLDKLDKNKGAYK